MNKSIFRNDVWLVNFDPTVGDEIKKSRPAIVVNRNLDIGLNLFIIVPVTKWHEDFSKLGWIINIPATNQNGLKVNSAINCFRVRSLSGDRFIKKLGQISDEEINEIANGIAYCIGV